MIPWKVNKRQMTASRQEALTLIKRTFKVKEDKWTIKINLQRVTQILIKIMPAQKSELFRSHEFHISRSRRTDEISNSLF